MLPQEIFRKIRTGFCVAVLFVCAASGVSAQELTTTGVQLAPVVLSGLLNGVVERQVALGGDSVESTHVVVQLSGSPPLMRDRQGLYRLWDIDPAHLIDNGFPQSEGRLNFKILNQDLSLLNFPIRVTVYYRANGELKFGYFDVMRAN